MTSTSGDAPAPDRTTVHVRYTPKDRETGRYQYVPFDVPEGATRVTIDLRYDRAGGANALDLGLFEPGSLALGSRAFRGWSGGERAGVTITPQYATPGYWPGPLPAGQWHLMLGLYKVAEAGLEADVQVEIGREPAGPTPALPERPAEPLRRGPAWYSGALHMHTVHSDGVVSAATLVKAAAAAGLDFVAITDHNNTAHQLEAVEAPGLLRIVGEEITTPAGHVNVWGLGGWRDFVDFRVPSTDGALADLLAAAAARGAVVGVNHPLSDCAGCDWPGPIPAAASTIEIVNPGHAHFEAAIALWDGLLRQGRRITGIAAPDWHRPPQPLGAAVVRVWADELSTPAVLRALREGRVIAMADARLAVPRFTAHAGARTAQVGETLAVRPGQPFTVELAADDAAYQGARVVVCRDGAREGTLDGHVPLRVEARAGSAGYVRAEVWRADGVPLAVTNPIWIAPAAR